MSSPIEPVSRLSIIANPAGFYDIPIELQVLILKHALVSEHGVSIIKWNHMKKKVIAIFLTSKEVFKIAAEVFYGLNRFTITSTPPGLIHIRKFRYPPAVYAPQIRRLDVRLFISATELDYKATLLGKTASHLKKAKKTGWFVTLHPLHEFPIIGGYGSRQSLDWKPRNSRWHQSFVNLEELKIKVVSTHCIPVDAREAILQLPRYTTIELFPRYKLEIVYACDKCKCDLTMGQCGGEKGTALLFANVVSGMLMSREEKEKKKRLEEKKRRLEEKKKRLEEKKKKRLEEMKKKLEEMKKRER